MATQFDEHVRIAATVDTRAPAAGATRPRTESDTDFHRATPPQTVAQRAPATRGAPSHEDGVRLGLQLLLGYEWWASRLDNLPTAHFPPPLLAPFAGPRPGCPRATRTTTLLTGPPRPRVRRRVRTPQRAR